MSHLLQGHLCVQVEDFRHFLIGFGECRQYRLCAVVVNKTQFYVFLAMVGVVLEHLSVQLLHFRVLFFLLYLGIPLVLDDVLRVADRLLVNLHWPLRLLTAFDLSQHFVVRALDASQAATEDLAQPSHKVRVLSGILVHERLHSFSIIVFVDDLIQTDHFRGQVYRLDIRKCPLGEATG